MSLIEEVAEDAGTITAPELAIPARIGAWIAGNWLRLLLIAMGVAVAIGVVVYGINALTGGKKAQVQGKLDSAMAGAAMTNAADAVTMVKSNITNEHNITNEVNHVQAAVQAATDTAGADAAGRAGLCAISPGFCPTSGMQPADPR